MKPIPLNSAATRRRRWFRIFLAFALLGASLGFGSWSYQATERSQTYTASFIGRNSCAACHSAETQKWTGSHHDLAMDLATSATVVDPKAFDDQEFTAHGITSKFFRRGEKFFVTTDGPTGALETFEVKYVFGVDPLQQYMVEFPDKKTVRNPQGQEIELPGNRVQVLSIAWDTQKHRWFHLYPTRKFPAGDWLHWTGGGQNWNYMCAECHSTDLQRKYDLATNTYHTTFAEIDVSCEACHGPAGEHVARAGSTLGFNDPRHFHSYALNNLKSPDTLAEIETCAQCHARHHIVHGDYRPGRNYHDHYEPSMLDGNLYHADGQIREELYEYGSFLQSRMFREGVRCSNCHDPHSLKPKFPGNALCTQCHIPAKYDTPTHHHHKFDSTGAKCVECHMPETIYMEVDPRRDHSIRIPRPDLTKKLGTPNACGNCHKKPEESVDWLMAKVVEWYGPKRSESKHYGEALEAGRRHDPHAAAGLIDLAKAKPTLTTEERAAAVGPIVRAGAVALLAGYDDDAARQALEKAAADRDPLVRVAAIHAIEQRSDQQLRPFRSLLLRTLDDPIRNVRTEAAKVLTRAPPVADSPRELREKFQDVFQEWIAGQSAAADRAEPHTGIGTAYTNLLRSTEEMKYAELAEAEFQKALRLNPAYLPAVRNYAALQDLINKDEAAEKLLRQALAMIPKLDQPEQETKQLLADTDYELGWLLLRDPRGTRLGEALAHFESCIKNDPNNVEAMQYQAFALLGLNRFTAAAEALTRLCKLAPQSSGLLVQYAERAVRSGQMDQARTFLEVLLAVDPAARTKYPQINELLRQSAGR
ncbi:MAG: HEAT repeat domain-containing protein [Planctomycetia bacterium]|nr:HEAT repeat domain-containing protein [Planctomycetia bacterium]